MKTEDLEFLKLLQKELLTQDNQGQASPVYWGIMETKRREVPNGCGDETVYRLGGHYEPLSESELIEYVQENYYSDFTDELKEEWDGIVGEELGRTWDLTDFCDDHCGGCESFEVKYEDELSRETGCFLTKKSAEEYIQRFGYNHSSPKTYAMTAYRNFELERLLNIIMDTDWEQIK